MTIKEAIVAAVGNGSITQRIEKFTKAFRVDELGNIEEGEVFTIPTGDDYVILSRRMMRGGQPVLDRDGNPVTAEFIKCQTTGGRIVDFFPSSLTKIAFTVDPETGKDLTGAERIKRPTGNLVAYVKAHPDMNLTMEALKGCSIKLAKIDKVNVRTFGVPNDKATKANVEQTNIGTWELAGDKKPENWTV